VSRLVVRAGAGWTDGYGRSVTPLAQPRSCVDTGARLSSFSVGFPIPASMHTAARSRTSSPIGRLLLGVIVAGMCSALSPSISRASLTTFGSPLSVPATLNTAVDLNYQGTNTPVLPSTEAPSGVYHTFHYGADTALWNVALASGTPDSPATGQAVNVRLEGCAQPAASGLAPLTQIHFQDVSRLPRGGAKVNLTSQPFDIPVCGRNGVSGSTVTTYVPINLCVSKGDYVDLNEEGGFVEYTYQNGVPYRVLGAAHGSTTDTFIMGDKTGNGATFSSRQTAAMDGFASNLNEELMLQVTLGTGRDATHICAGGTRGLPPALAPIRISPQTDGVNHSQVVAVAVYCRPALGCSGVATLGSGGKAASYGRARFSLPGDKTRHLPIRISSHLMELVRRHHGARAQLTLAMGARTFTQTIMVKIL
jgi:hypothetical protein